MIDITYKKDLWDNGSYEFDFGWKKEKYDYVIELLRRSTPALPTYEDECCYLDIIEKLESRRDDWNNRAYLTPEEMAQLMSCMLEFMFEADTVMNICGEEHVAYSESMFEQTVFGRAFLN